MIVYLLMAVALVGGGFYAGSEWQLGRWAKAELAQAAMAATIVEQAAAAKAEATNKITDMEAAFEAGQAEGRVVEKKVLVRVGSDLAKYPVFQNPACVLPAESYALLVASMKGVRSGVVIPDGVLTPSTPSTSAARPLNGAANSTPAAPVPPSGGPPPKPVPKRKAP